MGNDKKISILGHIAELRRRLIISIIAIIITTLISFVFADEIFNILTRPIEGYNLIYIEITEMIGAYTRVCLASGVILAMPFLIYQFVMFVSPALMPKEKKYVYLVLPWVALMFIGGVVFAYFIMLPPALKFLFTFGSDIAAPQIKIGNYISVVSRILFAVGLVFELPVITTFLARIGIVSPKWLASKRKFAFIFAFILAAIITPTIDPINQCLVAVPLIVLYEMSIWLARLVYRRESREVVAASAPAS